MTRFPLRHAAGPETPADRLHRASVGLLAQAFHPGFESTFPAALSELIGYEVRFWRAPRGLAPDAGLAPRDSVLAYVFQNRRSLNLDRLPPEVRLSSPAVAVPAASAFATPVIARDPAAELLGILVFTAPAPDAFGDAEADLFEKIAAEVAEVLRGRERAGANRATGAPTGPTPARPAAEWIGEGAAARALLGIVDKVAPTQATALILGESGTGKELVAARIHARSARADGPFVAVNCGALNENLLESELFGHEAGAFTGAVALRRGLCETAHGGTLFLDEVGEMSRATQTKLLRFLEGGEFHRVGGRVPVHSDARVIAATNRDLAAEVAAGRFREDLFYRLNAIALRVPALRDRPEDLPALCAAFLGVRGRSGRALTLDPEALAALRAYAWPGNVRELRNVIERLRILAEGTRISARDLPAEIRGRSESARPAPGAGAPLGEVERSHILRTLDLHGGNKARTARALGITLKTLYNKLHRYEAARPASVSRS